MTSDKRWLLPDGIDELLPDRAGAVEHMRRALLDECARWGFQFVIPPLVEFTDSLLVGLGADLDVLTCKFSDRLSGRTLGVRADMTPQTARIDAHSLGEEGVTRLCYAGSTLHSAPQSLMAGRSPIQLGAEIYGCADPSADLEIIDLMLALVSRAAGQDCAITLDIGHVGVYEALLAELDRTTDIGEAVFDALQRKSLPDLQAVIGDLPAELAASLLALTQLHGSTDVLSKAHVLVADLPSAKRAIEEVEAVVSAIERAHPNVAIYIDLAELRGFQYHTGLVFAAYIDGHGAAIAKGGRYDNVGSVFGRARPATGFACDLKALTAATQLEINSRRVISAPVVFDQDLELTINHLREDGCVVIRAHNGEHDHRCNEQLIKHGTDWVCEPRA